MSDEPVVVNSMELDAAELGGEIYVCSACDQVCSVPSDDEAVGIQRHPAIRPLGMSAVLADMTEGRCVTF